MTNAGYEMYFQFVVNGKKVLDILLKKPLRMEHWLKAAKEG